MFIEFGGEHIQVVDKDNDKILSFKERSLLLSQLVDFYNRPDFLPQRIMAGIDKDNKIPFSKSHNRIRIGCLTDTNDKFFKLLKFLTNGN